MPKNGEIVRTKMKSKIILLLFSTLYEALWVLFLLFLQIIVVICCCWCAFFFCFVTSFFLCFCILFFSQYILHFANDHMFLNAHLIHIICKIQFNSIRLIKFDVLNCNKKNLTNNTKWKYQKTKENKIEN